MPGEEQPADGPQPVKEPKKRRPPNSAKPPPKGTYGPLFPGAPRVVIGDSPSGSPEQKKAKEADVTAGQDAGQQLSWPMLGIVAYSTISW